MFRFIATSSDTKYVTDSGIISSSNNEISKSYFIKLNTNLLSCIFNMLSNNDIQKMNCIKFFIVNDEKIHINRSYDVNIFDKKNKLILHNINFVIKFNELFNNNLFDNLLCDIIFIKSIEINNNLEPNKIYKLNDMNEIFVDNLEVDYYIINDKVDQHLKERLNSNIIQLTNIFENITTLKMNNFFFLDTIKIFELYKFTKLKNIYLENCEMEYQKISFFFAIKCLKNILITNLYIKDIEEKYFLTNIINKQFYVKNILVSHTIMTKNILSFLNKDYLEGILISCYEHHNDEEEEEYEHHHHHHEEDNHGENNNDDENYEDYANGVLYYVNNLNNHEEHDEDHNNYNHEEHDEEYDEEYYRNEIYEEGHKNLYLYKLLKFENLRVVKIYGCNEKMYHNIKVLQEVKQLDTLLLNDCFFCNKLLYNISLIKQLKKLILRRNNIANQQDNVNYKPLTNLLNLTHLTISDCQFSDNNLKDFHLMLQLDELILYKCISISNNGIRYITQIKNLRSLKISMNNRINTAGFILLWNFDNLQSLYLSGMLIMRIFPYILCHEKTQSNLKIFEYDFYYEQCYERRSENTYRNIFKDNISENNFMNKMYICDDKRILKITYKDIFKDISEYDFIIKKEATHIYEKIYNVIKNKLEKNNQHIINLNYSNSMIDYVFGFKHDIINDLSFELLIINYNNDDDDVYDEYGNLRNDESSYDHESNYDHETRHPRY